MTALGFDRDRAAGRRPSWSMAACCPRRGERRRRTPDGHGSQGIRGARPDQASRRVGDGPGALRVADQRPAGRRSSARARVDPLLQTHSVSDLRRDRAAARAAAMPSARMLGGGWWTGPLMCQAADEGSAALPVDAAGRRVGRRLDADDRDRSVVAGDDRRPDPPLRHLLRRDVRRDEGDARLGSSRALPPPAGRPPRRCRIRRMPRRRCSWPSATSRSAWSRSCGPSR